MPVFHTREPMVTYGASCFAHKKEKIYLYRSKYGHWCIGSKLGKIKNGTLLKSCERDEEKWAHCCPCTIKKWLRRDSDSWVKEEAETVKIIIPNPILCSIPILFNAESDTIKKMEKFQN